MLISLQIPHLNGALSFSDIRSSQEVSILILCIYTFGRFQAGMSSKLSKSGCCAQSKNFESLVVANNH